MSMPPILFCLMTAVLCATSGLAQEETGTATDRLSPELAAPVRIEADGKPIDIGLLSRYGHAGPTLGDADGDGDRDLLVGDFPGYFWLFKNTATDENPVYTRKGRLRAGGKYAKTPVY